MTYVAPKVEPAKNSNSVNVFTTLIGKSAMLPRLVIICGSKRDPYCD